MTPLLRDKYEQYKKRIDFFVSYEDFIVPSKLIAIHEKFVGTVIKKYDKQLRIYDHVTYFGCMLFFSYLSTHELTNGPIVWEDQLGNVNCL